MLRRDTYINDCFVTCLLQDENLVSDCLLGCGISNGNNVYELLFASCQSDPARSCLQTYAARLEVCSEIGSPPPICQSCSDDQVCLASCTMASDCPRLADDLYAFCLARG